MPESGIYFKTPCSKVTRGTCASWTLPFIWSNRKATYAPLQDYLLFKLPVVHDTQNLVEQEKLPVLHMQVRVTLNLVSEGSVQAVAIS